MCLIGRFEVQKRLDAWGLDCSAGGCLAVEHMVMS